ncbi:MAG: hypothetical protein AAF394_05135, partial [Planctomycetota bacterium]
MSEGSEPNSVEFQELWEEASFGTQLAFAARTAARAFPAFHSDVASDSAMRDILDAMETALVVSFLRSFIDAVESEEALTRANRLFELSDSLNHGASSEFARSVAFAAYACTRASDTHEIARISGGVASARHSIAFAEFAARRANLGVIVRNAELIDLGRIRPDEQMQLMLRGVAVDLDPLYQERAKSTLSSLQERAPNDASRYEKIAFGPIGMDAMQK